VVQRDRTHPVLIGWSPIDETGAAMLQQFMLSEYGGIG
jgi:hypothetical protein